MEVFKINGEEKYISEEDLKRSLLEHMGKGKKVRVYWERCSENAKLLPDGTIKALGRIGGYDWHKHIIYKDFNNWFEESIIKERALDIEFK